MSDPILGPEEEARKQETAKQGETIKEMLQNQDFAVEMASWQDGAYYRGQGQTPPEFDAKPVEKEVSENVAMNLAGFYAVECGIGAIAESKGIKPIEVLKQIVDSSLDDKDMLLIARFANATWKAGQPFRSMSRIAKDNFVPAATLSESELKKDYDQIHAAAEKMLEKMK
jgi:hypothetical protein